jgi:hypothetical protein
MQISTEEYIGNLADALVSKNKKLRIVLTRDWTKQFPKKLVFMYCLRVINWFILVKLVR